jgi:hypothetical protein
MAPQITLPENVSSARTNADALAKISGDYSSESYNIETELKRVVQEALDYNKDIIEMRSSALGDYLAAPEEAGSRFGTKTFETGDQAGQANPNYVFNPFERNAVIADYVKNEEVPFMTANTLYGMRTKSAADTVKAGTSAFQAKAAAAEAAAQAARQTYQDVLSEFTQMEQLQQGRQSLDIQQQSVNKSGAGKQVAPGDQNAQLVASLNNVQAKMQNAIATKGHVTKEDVISFWNVEAPLLSNLGIDQKIIQSYMNETLGADEVVDTAPQTFGQKVAPIAGAAGQAVGRVVSPVSSFVQQNPSPTMYVGNAINDFLQSNIQKGSSLVNTFLNQFK